MTKERLEEIRNLLNSLPYLPWKSRRGEIPVALSSGIRVDIYGMNEKGIPVQILHAHPAKETAEAKTLRWLTMMDEYSAVERWQLEGPQMMSELLKEIEQ